MGIEFELKFRADPSVQDRIRRDFGPWQEIAMHTRYYDTPSGALSARRYTLRRRMENGVSVCTLKTPAGGGARGEWETQCGDILEAVPALIRLGAPEDLEVLLQEGLQEICGARFTRLACLTETGDGTVEIALDRGILTGGSREQSLCEVEAELKSGTAAEAERFARELARKYALEPEKKSKFRRALDLAKGV